MADYRPGLPFTVPVMLLVPSYVMVKGVRKAVYPGTGPLLSCSYKTYGGTDTTINGVVAVEDTGYVETWYRPDIKPDCHIRFVESGEEYEILGKPENINMRGQFCKFKVHIVTGGA